jgi:hypothetical protein
VFAKILQMSIFLRRGLAQLFRRFTRVAAQLLHSCRTALAARADLRTRPWPPDRQA